MQILHKNATINGWIIAPESQSPAESIMYGRKMKSWLVFLTYCYPVESQIVSLT
jgi:hypothetical protein